MSEHSPNLNLNLYSEADVKEKFVAFLEALAGSSEESNMMLLDAAIKAVQDALPKKADLINGQIPASQLPSFVDDVVEYSAKTYFPILGETGKIYVDTSTNLAYRWSGSTYAEISPSLALGETQSTAFRGDLGKEAYEHSLETGNAHGATAADIGARPSTWTPTSEEVGALPLTGGTLSGSLSIGTNPKMEQADQFSVEINKEVLTVGDGNLAAGRGAAAIGRQNVVCPGESFSCYATNGNQLEMEDDTFWGNIGDKIILVSANINTSPQVVEVLEVNCDDEGWITLVTTPFTGSPTTVILPDFSNTGKIYYSGCAEGTKNTAMGKYGSHAEGYRTIALGIGSHAEGGSTNANGKHSHAEGYLTKADGLRSHAEGYYTIAAGSDSHVEGKYNIEDAEGQYLHIAGNGSSSSARSNAYTLDWDGNGWYAGKVSAGTVENPAAPTQANDLATKKYVDDTFAQSAPAYLSGTEDLTAGTSPLETGKLYFMYE